jgi:hypothetical protein
MQIIRTEVAEATALSGEPILRVQFCGEGGECVTVDMAKAEQVGAEAALERARTILAQTATFGVATNDYEAQSNGNFDEVAVANDENAGIYIFEYRDGDGGGRVPPARMPSLDAAREEAIRCAIDLLADLEPGTDDLFGWLVRVRGANGELLLTIDVQAAEAARQAGAGGSNGAREGDPARTSLPPGLGIAGLE